MNNYTILYNLGGGALEGFGTGMPGGGRGWYHSLMAYRSPNSLAVISELDQAEF